VGRYAVGFAAIAIVFASLAVAAVGLRERLLADWRGAPARLAELVLGLALLIGILEALGAVGLFRLVPIIVACVGAAAGLRVWFGPRRGPDPAAADPAAADPAAADPAAADPAAADPAAAVDAAAVDPAASDPAAADPAAADPAAPAAGPRRPPPLAVAVAMIAAALMIAEWTVPMLFSYDVGIRSFDSLWYHLPWAASFAQTGRVTSLRFTDVEYLTAFYPATGELLHGLGIVLLGRDTLSPAINLGWLSLCLLAAWCIGSPRALGPATLTGAALALATPMMRITQGGTAANDIAGVFFLLAAVALVVNADAMSAGRTRALAIAAIAAGLAVSVKLTMLAPVLALSVGTILLAARGRRRRAAVAWIPAFVLAAGYWYVRNLIAVGNPLPWVGLGILPTPAAPLQQQTGFAIVHYATNTQIWARFFAPVLASGLGPWWIAIIGVAVLGPVLCVLGRSQRTAQMLGVVALASLAAYLITPETAAGPAGDPLGFSFNLRYAAPGLTLALAVTPLASWLDGPRARMTTLAVLGALLAVTLAENRLWTAGYAAVAILVGCAALAMVGAAIGLARRPPARAAMLAGASAVLAAVAFAGFAGERHYLNGRYTFRPGSSSLSTLWAWARGIHHARIGLVGTFGGFFSYPLLGVDDSNRVQYIADHGPHGSFTPIRTCRAWRAAVNAGHYRYVVTTPGRNPWNPRTLAYAPEGDWTRSDPAAVLVLRNVAYSQPIAVYELTGPLDPSGCPA